MQDWQHNVRAIALGMEALRRVDRYGIGQGAQYAGYKQLGAGTGQGIALGGMTRDEAAAVLSEWSGFPMDADESKQSARARWRSARAAAHPDSLSGNREAWDRVEQAAQVLGLTL